MSGPPKILLLDDDQDFLDLYREMLSQHLSSLPDVRVASSGSRGLRGVQSKSLVDIIQLECLSQSSTVLKITNGILEGKIWIQNGEVIDAEAPEATAEPAFGKILAWKTGSFENLPPEPDRVRTIFTSYQGLLLNTAQALDEAASQVALPPMADWMHETMDNFRALGERLQVGQMQQVVGTGPQRKVALAPCGKSELCVGFPPSLSADQLRDTMKSILTKWAS